MTRKRLFWIILGLLLLVIYVPIGDYDDEAIVIARNDAGEWEYEGDAAFDSRLRLSTESLVTTASTRSGTNEDVEPWCCERIWIVNPAESRLARAVGVALQQDLLKQDSLVEVAYFGVDELPLDVRRPPHLYVVVHEESSGGITLPGYAQTHGTITLSASSRPHHFANLADVPISIQASIDYTMKSIGVTNPGARNGMIAESIVERFDAAAGLAWADESQPRVAPPNLDWILDEAEPPSDIPPFGANATSQHVYSQGGWLRHEESLWQVTIEEDPATWMTGYLDLLSEDGWAVDDERDVGGQGWVQARATKGQRSLFLSSRQIPWLERQERYRKAVETQGDPPKLDPTELPHTGPATFLVGHQTSYTGHEIRQLFLQNPDDWDGLLTHVQGRHRELLRNALEGDVTPALQDLATRLADD